MRIRVTAFVISFVLILKATAQTPSPDLINRFPQVTSPEGRTAFSRPYRAKQIRSSGFKNSARTYELIRAGHLYLSLQDAIALALENNLDIELQRFNPLIAKTDTQRAKAGSIVRGLTYTIRELPQGVGGPGSPLLTTVGGSAPATQVNANSADLSVINQQETNLLVQSTIPLVTGSPVPSYDPFLTGGANWYHRSTPQTASFQTGTSNLITETATGTVGLQQGFATGTTYSLAYNANRQQTNSLRADYNPFATASLSLTVTQPLLQGFGLDVNRRFIRIAQNGEKISNLIFNQQLISTVSSVIRLYWDLVSLNEDVKVKRQALTAAQRLYEDNKSQVEVGTLAPLQLKQAAAEVARSKQDLINSESLVAQQELIFKNVVTRSGADDPTLVSVNIVPLDRIDVPKQDPPLPIDDLVAEAFGNRPDLAQALLQIENANHSLKGSKNALLPQLNIIGGATNNALAGDPNSLPPVGSIPGEPVVRPVDPFLLGGTGTLFSQIFRRNYPDYGIGFQLTIPLRNRSAQADVTRDQLQVRQSEVRLKELQNQVRVEVQNALIALQRSRASYDAAVETRQLQEEALDAERQRFDVGQSTSFFVIQFQRDLEQARSTEVITSGNYAKAKAALDRALGRTLNSNHVSIDEALHGIVNHAPTAIPPDAK